MDILFSWLSIPRMIGIWIDSIAFGLIDNAYNLIVFFAGKSFFNDGTVTKIMSSTYIIISLFALFRLALLLVNAMISPDRLYDSKNGIARIGINVVIMFVLLIITPMLFREARDLQNFVVRENFIGKVFGLGATDFSAYAPDENGNENSNPQDDGYNPGKIMQKMVINALIYPDERLVGENSGNCTGKCPEIIEDYNNMMSQENAYAVDYGWLSRKITVSVDVGDEEVYVLHYYFIVTLACAGFIAYILFSFAIDIAVRSVELAVLEILSPLFIVTYIDPKSAKSGPFHNWLTTVGKTYVSLFIKLAIVSIMLVLVTLVSDMDFSGGGLMAKIIMLFAILIFAKKAPAWISGMIGIKDSEGLGGLNIGKKLAGAALIGGAAQNALNKGKNALAGAGLGLAKNAHAYRKAKKNQLKDDNNRATNRLKDHYNANRANSGILKSALSAAGTTYFKEAGKNMKNFGSTFGAGAVGALTGIAAGAKDGFQAKDIKEVNSKTKATAKATFDRFAPNYQSIPSKVSEKAGNVMSKIANAPFGGTTAVEDQLQEARKKKAANEKAKAYFPGFSVDANGERNKIQNPVKVSEAKLAVDKINSGVLNGTGISLSSASKEGIAGAMAISRLTKNSDGTFSYNGQSVSLSGNGISVNGGPKISYSEFCKSNNIMSVAGEKFAESCSREIATQNLTRYDSTVKEIASKKEFAAQTEQQILSFQANMKTTRGDAAYESLLRLDAAQEANIGSSITNNAQYMSGKNSLVTGYGNEMIKAETDLDSAMKALVTAKASGATSERIIELENNVDIATKERDKVRLKISRENQMEVEKFQVDLTNAHASGATQEQIDEIENNLRAAIEKSNKFNTLVKDVDAYEELNGYTDASGVELKVGAIKAVDSIPGVQQGTAQAYMRVTAARDDANNKISELTKESERIKDEIIIDLENNEDKSAYRPEDYDGTVLEAFVKDARGNYVANPEFSRVISAASTQESKAKEALSKATEKDKK